MTLSQWLLQAWDVVRHPAWYAQQWYKWYSRPAIGERVEDCYHRVMKVVAFGDTEDDLIFSDGTKVSWMHCCNHVKRVRAPRAVTVWANLTGRS